MCTAFSAGSGKLYKFNRMPFGYTGSGGFFQRSVENVLAGILYSRSLVYLDDVLVLGKSFADHCTSLDMVLSRLYDAGIRLKLKKCKFFTNETNYLGHIISDKGIKPNPEKTRAIEQWKKPTNIKDIRQFHGLISYYRKFIPNFARRAAPLTDLMKGKRVSRGKRQVFIPCKFDWTHIHDKAFEDLKKALLEEVCLAHPDFNSNFILELDASRSGLGAVLSQRINGELRPIAFASRKTSVSESNYPAHKLEFLSLRWAVTHKFKDFLHNTFFEVYTDSNPLFYIVDKMDIDATSQRWLAELSKYQFKIHYRTGRSNKAADALSRLDQPPKYDKDMIKQWCEDICDSDVNQPIKPKEDSCTSHMATTNSDSSIDYETNKIAYSVNINKVDVLEKNDNVLNWKEVQHQDRDICFVRDNIIGNNVITTVDINRESSSVKHYFKMRKDLILENDLVFLKTNKDANKRLLLNDHCLDELMKFYHNKQGHLGQDRVIHIFQNRFYWPSMTSQIKLWISTCKVCLSRKTLPCNNKYELHHRPVGRHPFDVIALDHLIVETQSAKKKALTIVDEFSKFLIVIPVKGESAKVTADSIVKYVFMRYGIPNKIHTDNATSFSNKVMKELTSRSGIEHTKSTPYHSQGNPICERANQLVLNMLGTLSPTEKYRWYDHCEYISYAYNTTVHSTTGLSPFFVLYGRQPKLISDAVLGVNWRQPTSISTDRFITGLKKAYKLCKEQIRLKQISSKVRYDHKLNKKISPLHVGDIVLVKNHKPVNKIDNRWCDDNYEVIDHLDDIPVFEVKNTRTGKVISRHRNDLLLLYKRGTDTQLTYSDYSNISILSQDEVKVPSSTIDNDLSEHVVDSSLINHSQSDPTSTMQFSSESVHSNGKQSISGSSSSHEVYSSSSDIDWSNIRLGNRDQADQVTRTRSGRITKPPVKLNLCIVPSDYQVV